MMNHDHFMHRALELARQALDQDEFPVGCILVHDGRIVAEGARINSRGPTPSELDHAEMVALRHLEGLAGRMDRHRMTLYATLEPCLMCFGALLISGLGHLVYAYEDAMGGGTGFDRSRMPSLYRDNPLRIVSGICRNESLALFKDYFSRPHIAYWRGSLLAEYTLAQPAEALH